MVDKMSKVKIVLNDDCIITRLETIEPLLAKFPVKDNVIRIGRTAARFKPIINYLRNSKHVFSASSKEDAIIAGIASDDVDETVVALDVGGRLFHARRAILAGGLTYFESLFKWNPEKTDFTDTFIDRDPDVFQHILDYIEYDNTTLDTIVLENEFFGFTKNITTRLLRPNWQHDKNKGFTIVPDKKYNWMGDSAKSIWRTENIQQMQSFICKYNYTDVSIHDNNITYVIDRSSDLINGIFLKINIKPDDYTEITIDNCYDILKTVNIFYKDMCGDSDQNMYGFNGNILRLYACKNTKYVPIMKKEHDNTLTITYNLGTYFSHDTKTAIPHIAMHYMQATINICFHTTGITIINSAIITDNVYLQSDERREFAQRPYQLPLYNNYSTSIQSNNTTKTIIDIPDGFDIQKLYISYNSDGGNLDSINFDGTYNVGGTYPGKYDYFIDNTMLEYSTRNLFTNTTLHASKWKHYMLSFVLDDDPSHVVSACIPKSILSRKIILNHDNLAFTFFILIEFQNLLKINSGLCGWLTPNITTIIPRDAAVAPDAVPDVAPDAVLDDVPDAAHDAATDADLDAAFAALVSQEHDEEYDVMFAPT